MKLVLIIDDDAFSRNVFAQTLTRRGFDVRHAGSRDEGLAVLRKGGIDLIVLDGGLADCDPAAFLEELREHGAGCPIVFLTSLFRDADEAQPHGPHDVALVLHKPISPVEFCARIENIFDDSEAHWLPSLGEHDLFMEAESSRVAYREALHERLEEFERMLEALRADGKLDEACANAGAAVLAAAAG